VRYAVTTFQSLKWIPRGSALAVSVVFSFFTSGCAVTGSGNVVEETHDLPPVDSIELGDGFVGRVLAGPDHRVRVRADDNLIDDVEIEVRGALVSIDLGGLHHHDATLEVEVTLPRLFAASLRDGSIFEVDGIPLGDGLDLDLSGGSILRMDALSGELIDRLAIESSGGSVCEIEAEATTTLISISGGGTADLRGSTKNMTLDLSGGSVVEAWAYPTENLAFDLSGGSTGSVVVDRRGQGELSGGSVLEVGGEGDVEADESGGSSLVRH
jgi:hypothetical protein